MKPKIENSGKFHRANPVIPKAFLFRKDNFKTILFKMWQILATFCFPNFSGDSGGIHRELKTTS